MPRWFGEDEQALDRAGLKAIAATCDRLGSAAYATLVLSTLMEGCDDGVVGTLDIPLFCEGLDDFLARYSDPRRSNSVTHDLYVFAFVMNCFDATTTSPDPDTAALAKLRVGFAPFVRRHVRTLIPQMWNSADEARGIIAHAYAEEIAAGAVIRVENGEIVIDMPATTAPTSS